MRKMMNILAAALVMLAAISCEKNETLPDNSAKGKITLSATISNGATKTQLGYPDNNEYPLYWSEDDAIAVINNGKLFEFTLSDGYGTTNGTFTCSNAEGFDETKGIQAFYPYTGVGYNNGAITYTVPSTQNYQAALQVVGLVNSGEGEQSAPVRGSFGSGSMPMAACRAAGNNGPLSFDNLFGVLKLQLKGNTGEKVTSIVVTSDKVLNGAATLTIGSTGNSIALTGSEISNNAVTLNCGDSQGALSADNVTEFLVALPANAESQKHSFQITVNTTIDSQEKTYDLTTQQAIFAGQILKMPGINLSVAYIENGVYYGDGVELPAGEGKTIIWAPVNCGYDENHKYGLLYQWGRKDGQGYYHETLSPNETNPTTAAGTSENPDANTFYNSWTASSWTESNNPCPEGWRVPTISELVSLVKGLAVGGQKEGLSEQWSTISDGEDKYNGMSGFWCYGSTSETAGNKIFFPATGSGSTYGRSERGSYGYYWSSDTYSSTNAKYLSFGKLFGNVKSQSYNRAYGLSVRCVKE